MELNEAARRIFGQHWVLILVFSVLGVGLAGAMHVGDTAKYTASARMLIGAEDPKTSSESAAIADTAWALATAPSSLERAIATTHVPATDPADLAKRVASKGIGASGVLQLSVTDSNPRTAAKLANALASEVRQARLDAMSSTQRTVLEQMDRRLAVLDREIAQLEGGPLGPAARARLQSAGQQRALLETQRTSALLDANKQPRPQVLSAAATPAEPDPSGLVTDLLLGGILGLVLGTGLAALIETLRPTLVGGEALAQELGAPLLGSLSARTGTTAGDTPAVAGRLRLASKAAGVHNIGLLPLRNDTDLPRLAEQLGGARQDGEPDDRRIRPFDVGSPSLVNGSGTGLVIVAPDAPKKAELEEIRHLLALTTGPLLGVVTYSRGAVPRKAPDRNGHANGHGNGNGNGNGNGHGNGSEA